MIFITCALHCEAKPLIEKYRLVLDRDAHFSLFSRDNITLIVTGMGKLLMATAMSYAFARYHEPKTSAWLNVGVAGKKKSFLSDCYNINKVTDHASNTNWYPVRLPELSDVKTCSIITTEQPEKDYSSSSAHDMEASAFMMTALRFTTVELVQVLKITSDSDESSIENIDKKHVTEWVRKNLSTIDRTVVLLVSASDACNADFQENKNYQYCLNQWRFSAYQKKSLFRLLQQWETLNEIADIQSFSDLKNGKHVILSLENNIKKFEIVFAEKND